MLSSKLGRTHLVRGEVQEQYLLALQNYVFAFVVLIQDKGYSKGYPLSV